MENKELAALIATFIVAHGAATATVLWKGIQYGVKRLIDWERLLLRIETIEKNAKDEIEKQKAINEKLLKDLNAAHQKIRKP